MKTVDDDKQSYWSCRLAGSSEAYTAQGHFSSWSNRKCDHAGSDVPAKDESGCKPRSSSHRDSGWTDDYQGWYDVQGCGKCNDYCRWVNGTGSGGDPSVKTVDDDKQSYWSCRLAGSSEAYTACLLYTSPSPRDS